MKSERQVTILNEKGLHVRPATKFAQVAARFRSRWRLVSAAEREGLRGDALPLKLLQTASLMASAACLRPPAGRESGVREVRRRWRLLRRALRA